MFLVVLCFLIGWLLTGKFKMLKRGCGWVPGSKRKRSCSLCGQDEGCDKDETLSKKSECDP